VAQKYIKESVTVALPKNCKECVSYIFMEYISVMARVIVLSLASLKKTINLSHITK
jgi:hypothetical protein